MRRRALTLFGMAVLFSPRSLSAQDAEADANEVSTFESDCSYSYASLVVRRVGDRILAGGNGRWVLFDTTTRRAIFSGPAVGPATFGLAGQVALVPSSKQPGPNSTFELRSARDASIIATLQSDSWVFEYGFAYDGSYVFRYGPMNLDVWSSTGEQLVHLGSDLDPLWQGVPGKVSAQAGRLRFTVSGEIAEVDLKTRAWKTLPRDGDGREVYWFEDGRHYLVAGSGKSRIYDANDVLVQEIPQRLAPVKAVSNDRLGVGSMDYLGFGEFYFDPQQGKLHVFRVGDALGADGRPVPLLSVPYDSQVGWLQLSRGSLALVHAQEKTLRIIDLTGTSPQLRPTVSLPETPARESFTNDAGKWAITTSAGVIYASDERDPRGFHRIGCRAP